jgi:hypothetical protein
MKYRKIKMDSEERDLSRANLNFDWVVSGWNPEVGFVVLDIDIFLLVHVARMGRWEIFTF